MGICHHFHGEIPQNVSDEIIVDSWRTFVSYVCMFVVTSDLLIGPLPEDCQSEDSCDGWGEVARH